MRLGIRKGGKTFEVSVRGISSGELNELLYNRWRERCRKEVERLSDGRVGYVHIRAMDSESFRHLYSELLGRFRNCEAVVIDTRHNGGGWLHDDVVTLLGGQGVPAVRAARTVYRFGPLQQVAAPVVHGLSARTTTRMPAARRGYIRSWVWASLWVRPCRER